MDVFHPNRGILYIVLTTLFAKAESYECLVLQKKHSIRSIFHQTVLVPGLCKRRLLLLLIRKYFEGRVISPSRRKIRHT